MITKSVANSIALVKSLPPVCIIRIAILHTCACSFHLYINRKQLPNDTVSKIFKLIARDPYITCCLFLGWLFDIGAGVCKWVNGCWIGLLVSCWLGDFWLWELYIEAAD